LLETSVAIFIAPLCSVLHRYPMKAHSAIAMPLADLGILAFAGRSRPPFDLVRRLPLGKVRVVLKKATLQARWIMAVIMVLLTFGIFLLIDYARSHKQIARLVVPRTASQEVRARIAPAMVAGFEVPDNVRYHAGHTWALSESRDLVRVGMDDFASKLVGKFDSITLPKRGRWIRQGQKIWTIFRERKSVDMVSPIEGTVSDVNEAVIRNPELARTDPYGEGWLVTVQAPDAKTNFRNLLSGTLARIWTEDSARRLRQRMPIAMASALAQDGGVAVDDISAQLPDEDWATLSKELFLS
jgi:glycine cleavage system H lipoate-binding protein